MSKKFISMCLAVLMIFNLCGGAMAYGQESNTVISTGDMTFETEKTEDGMFILTGYLNGKLYDRVTMEMGSDIMYYQKLEEGNAFNEEGDEDEPQVYHVSDIITVREKNTSDRRASYVRKVGDIGSFEYKTSYETAVINFNSSFVKTVDGGFEVRGGAGLAESVIIAAIMTGFSYAITATLAVSIAFAVTSKIVEGVVTSSFSSYVYGDCYIYNIKSTKDDGTRTITKGGETYYGAVLRDGVYVDDVELYGDIYPEFLEERDYATASYFMSDYCLEPYTIMKWSPK